MSQYRKRGGIAVKEYQYLHFHGIVYRDHRRMLSQSIIKRISTCLWKARAQLGPIVGSQLEASSYSRIGGGIEGELKTYNQWGQLHLRTGVLNERVMMMTMMHPQYSQALRSHILAPTAARFFCAVSPRPARDCDWRNNAIAVLLLIELLSSIVWLHQMPNIFFLIETTRKREREGKSQVKRTRCSKKDKNDNSHMRLLLCCCWHMLEKRRLHETKEEL